MMGMNPSTLLRVLLFLLAAPLAARESWPFDYSEAVGEPGSECTCQTEVDPDLGLLPSDPRVKRPSAAGEIPARPSRPSQRLNDGFQWKGALLQSGFYLGLQHGFRMFTAETRRELDGPFLKDYFASVRGLKGWSDGDSWVTNYVAHPMMGAVAGYIQVHNDPRGIRQEFGKDPAYWKSRLKAMGWAAVYSTQFELGPISEASLGNVGQRAGTMGFVDLVITPLGGFGVMILEDLLDKYWIRKLEARTSSRNARGFYRIALNPMRSLANFYRMHHTYDRDTR